MKKNEIFTIPNLLTALRIFFVPVFIYLYLDEQYIASACMILVCGATDFLDGYIARSFHQISELGKALDPVADKLLQLAIVFCLIFTVKHMIWLFLLFIVKEISMMICWFMLKKKGGYINGALWFGKVSTAIFYLSTFALIALPIQNTTIGTLLMILTGFFLALSFILYMNTYFTMFRELKE